MTDGAEHCASRILPDADGVSKSLALTAVLKDVQVQIEFAVVDAGAEWLLSVTGDSVACSDKRNGLLWFSMC